MIHERTTTEYRGWAIVSHRQVYMPPCLHYVAYASILNGGKRVMFNVEGDSLSGAVDRAKQRIDRSN